MLWCLPQFVSIAIRAPMPSLRDTFIAAFLTVQLLYPARACFTDLTERPADFTWDMFSWRRDCETCKVYLGVEPDHRLRLPWGFRGTIDQLDSLGRGALQMHPERPALNLRKPPQIARMRYRSRLDLLGDRLCSDFRELFEQALSDRDSNLPEWAHGLAERWDRNGRQLRIEAECRCRYNEGPVRQVVDPDRNLCDGGGE